MLGEKQRVALTSVVAAVFLTVIKIIIGVSTGSLGLLSEAAHSAMDLGAAVVTFFAVRLSDKPADMEHHYGHGKIESFSALIETALLLATCGWIIYEAAERLFFGKTVVVSNTFWGIAVMALSIVINVSRAKALKKVAKKYGSQALEADALHFDSDVWSSLVVIGGLICVGIGEYLHIPLLGYGDPVAALGVSVLVIWVSIELGKRTIDVLLDTAPKGMVSTILHQVNGINGVLEVSNVRVRPAGGSYFIDLNVGLGRNESHRVIHTIVHEIRERIQATIPQSDITISTFPIDITENDDREIYHCIKKVVDRFPKITNIHNIHIYEVNGGKFIAIHIEVKENMNLHETHEISHEISKMVQSQIEGVQDVSVNFEHVKHIYIQAEDVTVQNEVMISGMEKLLNVVPAKLNCHDMKLYSQNGDITLFLHCALQDNYSTEKIELISRNIQKKIKTKFGNIENVHIHVEPMEKG